MSSSWQINDRWAVMPFLIVKREAAPAASAYHDYRIGFDRPDQRHEPADHAPTQEKVEQEDRKQVPLAARQRNDRREKVHHETQTEKRKQNHVRKMHNRTSLHRADYR